MTEIGPCFLFKILHLSYEDKQNAVANNLRWYWSERLWQIPKEQSFSSTFLLLSPADRYERDDLEHVISSFPILHQPNGAWAKECCGDLPLHPSVWDWGLHPKYHKKEWDWGFVLWDTERLIEWNII